VAPVRSGRGRLRAFQSPLVEDPGRLEGVAALGMDETSFLKATRLAPTQWVTGLVDLERGRLLDVVADRTRAAVDGWLSSRPRDWLAPHRHGGVGPLARLRQRSGRPAWPRQGGRRPLPRRPAGQHSGRAGAPSRAAGHPWASGRERDPLYRIRKLLLTAAEQLTSRVRVRLRAGLSAGDPGGEVAAAWQSKELLRAVYAVVDPVAARAALERFYRWSDGVQDPELSRLARTGSARQVEILVFHSTGSCSNAPIQAENLLTGKVKALGHGFRNFANHHLRLLHCGVTWHTH
jgi:transposase